MSMFIDVSFDSSDLLISSVDLAQRAAQRAQRIANTAIYEIQSKHVPVYIRTFLKIFRTTADNGTPIFKFAYFYWDSRTGKAWQKTENDNRLRNLPTIGMFGANLSPANGKGEKNANFVNVKLFDLAVKSVKHAHTNKLFGKSAIPTVTPELRVALESEASWLNN